MSSRPKKKEKNSLGTSLGSPNSVDITFDSNQSLHMTKEKEREKDEARYQRLSPSLSSLSFPIFFLLLLFNAPSAANRSSAEVKAVAHYLAKFSSLGSNFRVKKRSSFSSSETFVFPRFP